MRTKEKFYQELVCKIGEGNLEAEDQLFRIFYARIHHQVAYKIHNTSDIDEVSNMIAYNVLLAFRNKNFDSRKGTVAGYIFMIGENEIKGFLKNRIKFWEKLKEYGDTLKEIKNTRNGNSESLDPEYLWKQINKLPKKLRTAILLRYKEEYRIEDIQIVLELENKQKVYDLLSEGMKRLRKSLDKKLIVLILLVCFLLVGFKDQNI